MTIAPSLAATIIGMLAMSAISHAQAGGSWYYCDAAHAYYPYVTTCPVPWRPVPPYQQQYNRTAPQATVPFARARPAAAQATAQLKRATTAPAGSDIVANPSFGFREPYIFPGYLNPPLGWTVSGVPGPSGGVNVGATPFVVGGFWDNGSVPGQGATGSVAFIQKTGRLSQILSGLRPGTNYELRYYENARTYSVPSGQAPVISVLIGNSIVVPAHRVAPVGEGNPWRPITVTFVADRPDESLTFESAPSQPGADVTALFAEVSVTASLGHASAARTGAPSVPANPMVAAAVPANSDQAIGPSFDCNTVRTPLAQFICASPDLSRTDLEFVQAYYALRQQVGPPGWPALRQEDVDFQSRIESQCGIAPSGDLPPDAAALAKCLRQGYAAQRSLWLSRLSGAALEEANRPIGQHVALQRDLRTLGFFPPTATIDGVYGGATRSAILAWQQSRGLPETGFLGDADAAALARQASAGNPAGPPSVTNINSFACSDIIDASQETLIPIVGAEIQYMQRRYPDLTKSWGSFTQAVPPEAIRQSSDIGAFVKAKCAQPGEQAAPLASILDAAAGLMRAGRLEAWLDEHQASAVNGSAAPIAGNAAVAQVQPKAAAPSVTALPAPPGDVNSTCPNNSLLQMAVSLNALSNAPDMQYAAATPEQARRLLEYFNMQQLPPPWDSLVVAWQKYGSTAMLVPGMNGCAAGDTIESTREVSLAALQAAMVQLGLHGIGNAFTP